jgi:hypothetical protein
MAQRRPQRILVFVDESKANDYLLAASAVDSGDAAAMRKAVRDLVLPGQNRLHMAKESDTRRRQILDRIGDLPVATTIFRAPKDGRNEVERRARCVEALVMDFPDEAELSICFERDETLVTRDRRQVLVAAHQSGRSVPHRHTTASDEPLLAIPDALAWAWARGGPWRRRCPCTTERRPPV